MLSDSFFLKMVERRLWSMGQLRPEECVTVIPEEAIRLFTAWQPPMEERKSPFCTELRAVPEAHEAHAITTRSPPSIIRNPLRSHRPTPVWKLCGLLESPGRGGERRGLERKNRPKVHRNR